MDNANENPPVVETPTQLEGGTYEVIKSRLNKHAQDLRTRLEALNVERKKVFGAVELKLVGNSRINTENNCIPKDIFALGKVCLFGYNVHIGLRSEVNLQDVFSLYELQEEQFKPYDMAWLTKENPAFESDFKNLFKYYKDTTFVKFAIDQRQPFLYMIFQLSKDLNDTKSFKWEILQNGTVRYVTEAGEHKYKYPDQHQFEWKKTGRDMFRQGAHPHVSILDRVFVETIGGDLTIKVEDNTDTGKGIYAEAVQYPDQRLDDSEIYYANLGNLIVLKIRPYQEEFRYFVFNEKMQSVVRIDTLAQAGILLPSEQGLLFSNGFYLQTGDYKIFDKNNSTGFKFERQIASPNGEDFLYVFYSSEKTNYLLLAYNIISQSVSTPIYCNGYTLYPKGELTYFKSEETATKHHIIQIWQTPFLEGDFIPSAHTGHVLYKIGNKDIVRAMAECQELVSMLGKEDSYGGLYYDLTKKANDILDSYYWIKDAKASTLQEPLTDIRKAAGAAIDEFEKVQNIKKSTRQAVQEADTKTQALLRKIGQLSFTRVDLFVQSLAELRILRGEIISLRDLRYVDLVQVDTLEKKAQESTNVLSQECVTFLLKADALAPYHERVEAAKANTDTVQTAKQGKELEQTIDAIGKELELLIEIVTNLKIEDPTQTTKIIDSITSIFATLNQVKSGIRRRLRDLTGAESVAEFAAQMRLLEQAMLNYMDITDTPAKSDEYLTKLMVQMEEIESKFAEYEEFTLRITEKREEIYNAFGTRKLQLTEAINKRTASLQTAAERILNGVKNRAFAFKEVAEINGFFAADMMIEKVREIIEQLNTLGDTNKAGDVQTQLKTIKEEAIRQLRDKQELFTTGGDGIRLGKHTFSVNKQSLDLTMVLKGEEMYYHLTGTGFFELVVDAEFTKTRPVWTQSLVSEHGEVYRSEYLAYSSFLELQKQKKELVSAEVLAYVQAFSANRYQEGYSKGIHDEDAAKLLTTVLFLHKHIDLLHYPAQVRACANWFWNKFTEPKSKELYTRQLKSAGTLLSIFPNTREFVFLLENLKDELANFAKTTELFDLPTAQRAAQYLFDEVSRRDAMVVSGDAHELLKAFKHFLETHAAWRMFSEAVAFMQDKPVEQFQLARKWVHAFVSSAAEQSVSAGEQTAAVGEQTVSVGGQTISVGERSRTTDWAAYVDEAAAWLLLPAYQEGQVVSIKTKQELAGMFGSHPIIQEGGKYMFEYNTFMRKMEAYVQTTVPMYERFLALKKELTENFRQALRLEEFKPKPLTSFVRNKLIDSLYIPLFGDNLAKQIGTVGDTTRTDRMGMLLLISPPGYGKTTLIEYIANRLGLIFMKINGPALGHRVVSLDPKDADNAAARKELEKLNLGLEMGDNVMLYIDDIQHCNPEFLQKFISLTDGQRKIEGVYKGVAKTYDMRGKRVCVCMAGNPYTETGEKFRIPDMLANRSDIYNLGDIIGDTKEVFEMSYIENCLTANPILQKMAAKSSKDIYPILKYAQTDSKEGLDFEGNHTPQELSEYVEVVKRMIMVRDVLLKVNLEYIRSAATADEYRNEPSFKLQGSYRNMGKLAEKIVPILNPKEMETMVLAHYSGESQTLTTGAESNMLKLKSMMGVLTEDEAQRWKEIRDTFLKNKLMNGDEKDPVVQVVAQLSNFSDGLKHIKEAIESGLESAQEQANNRPAPISGVKFVKK